MNPGTQPLFVVNQDCDTVVAFVTTVLKSSGYTVLESFDLQSAMAGHDVCDSLPSACSCRMVVLLVYPRKGQPVSLVFDSNEHQTSVFLSNSVNKPNNSRWVRKLAHLLPEALMSPQAVNP